MWLKWLPWRYVVRRVARRHGFIDPIQLVAQLQRFAQPSEVAAPIELVRAGAVFHARGLMNSAVIQHNLDWVWPLWVERQFDPRDDAFIPRAFSITHVNLSLRNWTAVGLPDHDHLPLVDPAGLLTPWWDGWSIDAWLVTRGGRELLPSRARNSMQRLAMDEGIAVETETTAGGLALETRIDVVETEDGPRCRQRLVARSDEPGWLVATLRPYNPEGVSFVHEIELTKDRRRWKVENRECVSFSEPAERHQVSSYERGDVHWQLASAEDQRAVRCDVGLATAAASWSVTPGTPKEVELAIALEADPEPAPDAHPRRERPGWDAALEGVTRARFPDPLHQMLWDAALRTLVLHSPKDVYPGPFTYKRFWFRDAAFIVHALLAVRMVGRARRAIEQFAPRQKSDGYFESQRGEWDSNGQVLWTYLRFTELTGEDLPKPCADGVAAGAEWIVRKRLPDDLDALHAGLLPAGFSAEHLGPNDFYYWDDFWAAGGLRAAATLLDATGDGDRARDLRREADLLLSAVDRSHERSGPVRRHVGIAASPHRRMDAGAIGSLAAGYPLQLWDARDERLLGTVSFLMERCFYDGGFFQDMIHSGINAYLTLHCAQVLQRAGDPRCVELMHATARLASPTGQWPEAIHPRTLGGCMGDGQHAWAAAEWLLAQRAAFVREEGDELRIAEGVPRAWLTADSPTELGPLPTSFGDVHVELRPGPDGCRIAWRGDWRQEPPTVRVAPACATFRHETQGDGEVTVGEADLQ